MEARSQGKDIAMQLHTWATEEMYFQQGARMPSPEELRRICRGSHQMDLWKYVIDYVHSVQTVKKVKGNLQLNARSGGRQGYLLPSDTEKRQELIAQKEQLLREIAFLRSETQQLENELGRMEKDILEAELEYQKEMETVRDYGRKTCLVQVFSETSEKFSSNLDAFADRIETNIDGLVKGKKGIQTMVQAKQDNRDIEDDTVERELETTTSMDVRTSCEQIREFLQQTLQGTFNKSTTAFKLNKDALWKQVETTLSDHNVEQVIAYLVQQSQKGAKALRHQAAKFDIQKDAEKLRFKYEKGGVLTDMDLQITILQSIHQLLEENQLQHVMRFVEAEKYRNMARPLLENLDSTRSKIDSFLKQKFSLPSIAETASKLVQCQLDLVADMTARDCYRQEAEKLREKVSAEHIRRGVMLTLHRKIQDFQELANAKQGLIQVVAKQNGGAKSRLTAQQLEILQYVSRSIPPHRMVTQTLSCDLRGSITEEVNKVTALFLPYLARVYLNRETKCAVIDLSVNHTSHPTALSLRQPLQATLVQLHFPAYKAGECILQHCIQLKQEREENEELIEAMEKFCFKVLSARGIETDIDRVSGVLSVKVTELCDRIKLQDKEEVDKLLPPLQKSINQAARASTECIKIKNHVQAWWDQPAQFTTPWVKTEGLTFEQWYNKWRIIVTKIRQLDEQK